MKYYETKIGQIIEKEFDSRVELMVLTNIMDKGITYLQNITEEQISKVEGNDLMTAEFVQALVRCSVRIAKECTPMEIFEYIRLYAHFSPCMNELTLYKEDYTEDGWHEMCSALDVEEEKETINVMGIVEDSNE